MQNRMNEIVIDIIIEEYPRQFLKKLLESGITIPKQLASLDDDQCRQVIRAIQSELKAKENLQ